MLKRTPLCLGILLLLSTVGCYAPMKTRAIPACQLPESFRAPHRSFVAPLNISTLTQSSDDADVLRAGDLVEIRVPDLFGAGSVESMQARLDDNGTVYVPLAGPVKIGDLSFNEAHRAIEQAIGGDVLRSPRVSIRLVEKALVDVIVLGAALNPGTYPLPRDQADVAHALAAAGGLAERGSYTIEIHRKHERNSENTANAEQLTQPASVLVDDSGTAHVSILSEEGVAAVESQIGDDACHIETIDLRNCMSADGISHSRLETGDAIYVLDRDDDVFYVVGDLHPQARTRFTIGNDDRELGGGFLLPRDRDIDVITAVAMAGYIDPIESPTTVTVHRRMPDGESLLIRTDLIKARYDRRETVLIRPGDIVYLNPDGHWYFRQTFDRLLPDLIGLSYRSLLGLNR